MSLSFRTQSNAERDQVCSAVTQYLTGEDQNEVARGLLLTLLQPACEAWQMKRMEADVLDRELATAERRLAEAIRDFEVALQRLSIEIRNAQGDAVMLRDLVGVSPSRLLSSNLATQLRKAGILREQLRAEDLSCPAPLLTAFDSAVASLSSSSTARNTAYQARTALSVELVEAERNLDPAVVAVSKALKAAIGESMTRNILPAFVRSSARKSAETPPAQ